VYSKILGSSFSRQGDTENGDFELLWLVAKRYVEIKRSDGTARCGVWKIENVANERIMLNGEKMMGDERNMQWSCEQRNPNCLDRPYASNYRSKTWYPPPVDILRHPLDEIQQSL